MKHTTPWTRTDRSVPGSAGVPTSSSAGVGAVREDLADLAGDVPVVDERVVCAGLGDRLSLAWAAGWWTRRSSPRCCHMILTGARGTAVSQIAASLRIRALR